MLPILNKATDILNNINKFDYLAPLLVRLYLVPIFWMAGTKKLNSFEDTAAWFGNNEWGLGLPFPELLTFLVTSVEILGAVFLLFGFAVRWISIPLLLTMFIAAVTVHWKNGWLAIAEGSGFFASDRTIAAIERLDRSKDILQQHGNYSWLTEHGNLVMLNNGIEFAATYFIMLVVLIFIGGGRYVSADYWVTKYLQENKFN